MKAIIYTEYGSADVLHLKELEKPVPKDNEVLIKIHATTVSAGDCELRRFDIPLFIWLPLRLFMGILKPRKQILGQELAGEIEAVGKDVKNFQVGEQVFGTTGFFMGTHAEYICLPEESEDIVLVKKPQRISYEDAAPLAVGGLIALDFLRKANIQQGQKLLINGAGGTIGTFALQLAKLQGAEVTAVDSAGKLEMLRLLGADHVINYQHEDFSRNRAGYDIIFDVVGKQLYSHAKAALKPNGSYLIANPRLWDIAQIIWAAFTGNKKIRFVMASENKADLLRLTELIEAGKLFSVIDRRYPLEEMAAAHRYVESGQKKGHVVITV